MCACTAPSLCPPWSAKRCLYSHSFLSIFYFPFWSLPWITNNLQVQFVVVVNIGKSSKRQSGFGPRFSGLESVTLTSRYPSSLSSWICLSSLSIECGTIHFFPWDQICPYFLVYQKFTPYFHICVVRDRFLLTQSLYGRN